MTQDEIIRMAQEAAHPFHLESELAIAWWRDNFLPKFAALVAAHERERMKWDGIHTCNNDCDKPACVARRNAVLAEREACAKLVDNLYHETYIRNIRDCAAAIRARGEK